MNRARVAAKVAGDFAADLNGDDIDELRQGRIAQADHQTFHRDDVVGKSVGATLGEPLDGATDQAFRQVECETL